MKLHISFDFEKKSGGGSNFLQLLRGEFEAKGVYESQVEKSDVILFNSHHSCDEIVRLWRKFPEKVFIHRIDGPMQVYNDSFDMRDHIVNLLNFHISDGTIFQSKWSWETNIERGLVYKKNYTVIHNAPISKLVSSKGNNRRVQRKIKILISSWSSNVNKGFADIKWMDENLDFSKNEVHFVGNTKDDYVNIKILKAKKHDEFLKLICEYDLLFFPSKYEACSNLLLEALNNGLPVIALDSSSNSEILKKGGELYKTTDELPEIINKVVNNIDKYRAAIEVQDLKFIAENYYQFCDFVRRLKKSNKKTFARKKYFLTIKLKLLHMVHFMMYFLKTKLVRSEIEDSLK